MDIHDLLTNAAYLIVVLLAAGGAYIKRPRKEKDPIVSGVGFGFMEHDQAERLISAVEKISKTIADEKQSAMEDKMDDLLEQMKSNPAPRRR